MKYINSSIPTLFDNSTLKSYTNNKKYKCIGNGEAKLTLPNVQNTKLYVAFDLFYDTNYNYINCYPIQIYMSDGAYDKVIKSTIQVYLDASKKLIKFRNTSNDVFSASIYMNVWHRIYLVIDTVAGTVNFYLDGDKIGTYTDYVKTGVKAISCKIASAFWSNYIPTMKNIIISDQHFPMNETVIEVPATITNNGFTFDSSGDSYGSEAENSTLKLQPDLSVLNGYKVTGCNVGMGTTVLGDTIKNIQCSMGNYSDTKEIPANGYGMYFDELPTNIKDITLTAKK
ncbi:hypothetical protein [uncultured Anaerovibrio sp.]|uniref:hypothetical protein n=1 Tax=uncultured Anaerovibrio sp. TaxID=361586 RepID=UPI002618E957|nr:hypothetical protein [uncultured Anaerovibrio sp.]